METIMNTLYIDSHGSKVGYADGKFVLVNNTNKIHAHKEIPSQLVNNIIVISNSQLSHNTIEFCLKNNINIIFSSMKGGFQGSLQSSQNNNVERRIKQYDNSRNPQQRLYIAKALILSKIKSNIHLLQQWKIDEIAAKNTSLIKYLKTIIAKIENEKYCNNIETLLGYEGNASKKFFAGFALHLQNKQNTFKFVGRKKHPAPDPVNSVLSFIYTLLLNETEIGVQLCGLDKAAGFLHTNENGKPSLLCDLIEPLRPMAERLVAKLLTKTNLLSNDDFDIIKKDNKKACFLKDKHRGIIYKYWENLLNTNISYNKETTTYRRVIHLQAIQLVNYLEGKTKQLKFWHL